MPVKQIVEQQQVEAPTHNLILPTQFVGKFAVGDTTPSVKNVRCWICQNTGPVDITNFDDGQEGQTLKILGDGHSSVDPASGKIVTASGAVALMANKVYTFTLFNGVWYEDTHS